jgi:predicted molibdopterin-dependent oxidoreductase YjgC
VETIIEATGGRTLPFEEFRTKAAKGEFSAAWIVGGYPEPWVDKELAKCAEKIDFLMVQDLFENELTKAARFVLPACAWAEREGSFMNAAGLIQPFERAIDVPDGAKRDGQYLFEIAGFVGLFRAASVRQMMAESNPVFDKVHEAPALAAHAH